MASVHQCGPTSGWEEAEAPLDGPGCEEWDKVSQSDLHALPHLLSSMTSLSELWLGKDFECFETLIPPRISIADYAARALQYFGCSNECYVVALVYIQRFVQLQPRFAVNAFTAHRLLLASLVSAVKFTDDVVFSNSWYARVGGVSDQALHALELQFLHLIGWRMHVSKEEYLQHIARLRSRAPPSACPGSGAKWSLASIVERSESVSTLANSTDNAAGTEFSDDVPDAGPAVSPVSLSSQKWRACSTSETSSCTQVDDDCGGAPSPDRAAILSPPRSDQKPAFRGRDFSFKGMRLMLQRHASRACCLRTAP